MVELMLSTEAGIAQKVRRLANEHPRIDADLIKFPPMVTPSENENGQLVITDLNNVVEYHIGEDTVVPHDDYEGKMGAYDASHERAISSRDVVIEGSPSLQKDA